MGHETGKQPTPEEFCSRVADYLWACATYRTLYEEHQKLVEVATTWPGHFTRPFHGRGATLRGRAKPLHPKGAKGMEKMTITEGLAEKKTIRKRIAKKKEFVQAHLVRDGRLRDPLEKEGGTTELIRAARQAVDDLEKRYISIVTAIQRVNLATTLTINGITLTVSEWLTWRRDLAQETTTFTSTLLRLIQQGREAGLRQGRSVKEDKEATAADITVGVNEKALAQEAEELEKILGELDGKLSLVNATTTIEV